MIIGKEEYALKTNNNNNKTCFYTYEFIWYLLIVKMFLAVLSLTVNILLWMIHIINYQTFPLQLTYSYDTYYKAFPLHLPTISYCAVFKQKSNSGLQTTTLFISWEIFLHLWCHLFGQSHKSDIKISEHQPVPPPPPQSLDKLAVCSKQTAPYMLECFPRWSVASLKFGLSQHIYWFKSDCWVHEKTHIPTISYLAMFKQKVIQSFKIKL